MTTVRVPPPPPLPPPVAPPPPNQLAGKFSAVRSMLSNCLIERDDEIAAVLRCAVANEHMLLVGDPGTAKSLLCSSFGKSFTDAKVFEVLLTKYSTPEDCFGGIDVMAMKQGSYRRRIDNYMPTADIAFVDEVFKASTAILNALLTMMNERQYDNDGQRIQCPLRIMVGASNEWPQGDELGAMFDRFLLRRTVRPVSEQSLTRLLFDDLPSPAAMLSVVEWDVAHQQAMALPVSDEAQNCMLEIIEALASNGIMVGDRRKRKAIKIARAEAWLDNATQVRPAHLEPLIDVMWSEPVEQPAKAMEIITKLSNPQQSEVNRLLHEVRELDLQVKRNPYDTGVRRSAAQKFKEIEQTARAIATPRSMKVADHCKKQFNAIMLSNLNLSDKTVNMVTGS